MSIVKMRRLSLAAPSSDRDALFRELTKLGCVEISQFEADGEDAEAVLESLQRRPAGQAESRGKLKSLESAIALLGRYAPVKSGLLTPRDTLSSERILSGEGLEAALELARELDELERALRERGAEQSRLRARLETLSPWRELEVLLETQETKTCAVQLGIVPAAITAERLRGELDELSLEAELIEISADKNARYLLLLAHKSALGQVLELLRGYGFAPSSLAGERGTARENIEAAEARIEALEDEASKLEEEIVAKAPERESLKIAYDIAMTNSWSAENAERLLYTSTAFTFNGWAPEESLGELEAVLSRYDCAWEALEPKEEEYSATPVKLKNNAFTKPLNMITEMYSLPAYGSVDPNPAMAPFFILFYGMMLGDIAYGLLMLATGLLVMKKRHPRTTMGYMFSLMIPCGVSSIFFGLLTGSFMGDFIPQLIKMINPESTFEWFYPPLFTPINDTITVLIGAVAIGFLHILTGMAISFREKVRQGRLMDGIWDEGSWWLIFLGGGMAALGVGTVAGIPVVLAIGVIVLLVGAGREAKGFGKFGSALLAVYNGVTGYFGDLMSYSRLMALMLAGSVISQVFNTIGSITGSIPAFVFVALIGNALNFALNLLGCYVHDMRLQCLEFFGKFYQDGGKPFRPMKIDTQYYDVI
ncbi:MAG: V-type ATP synthase subunit I [Oscillospiraceae bacterium]|jgi:V/A-type H+-transporting ATPase subunit I|nr:V-type ATP synthase subunit I [Oscillospiraceae bacterium]